MYSKIPSHKIHGTYLLICTPTTIWYTYFDELLPSCAEPTSCSCLCYWKVLFHSNMVTQSLRWRHNERDSVSNHQPHDCLLNRLFRRRSKKTSKLRVTGLCAGNSPGTGEFPAQMASYAENVSIWWRHHDVATGGFQYPLWTHQMIWWCWTILRYLAQPYDISQTALYTRSALYHIIFIIANASIIFPNFFSQIIISLVQSLSNLMQSSWRCLPFAILKGTIYWW